jgi:hypothetical protein
MATVTIAMRGPYRSSDSPVSRSRYPSVPYYEDAPAADLSANGVYLQAVRLSERYRVGYVGETAADFCGRHARAVKAYCEPPFSDTTEWQLAACRQFGEVLELYPPLFREGVRAYVRVAAENTEQRCALRQEILDDTLIFFGALPPEFIEKRKSIESAIVCHLKGQPHRKGFPPAAAEFLYNELRGLSRENFGGTITIGAPANVAIEGLESQFGDPRA